MKRDLFCIISSFLLCTTVLVAYPQRNINSANQISASDLESHVSFLASPLLKGRMNGEEGLDIAALYLESQVKHIGLNPANGNSFFQQYSITRKTFDPGKTKTLIIQNLNDTILIPKPIYQLIPTGPEDLSLTGDVVFAGYGIRSEVYKYNDLERINAEGKFLMIMDRAPMSEDGNRSVFKEPEWSSPMSYQLKIGTFISSKAKAILIVPDPKSGFLSLEESNPGLAGYLGSKMTLTGEKEEQTNPFMAIIPRIIYIDRLLANELLSVTGHTLEELQKSIDSSFSPNSFLIPGKKLSINVVTYSEEKLLNNVAAYIKGRDPQLKDEVVVFSSHYDHIGESGSIVNPGADDNSSGCAALLSIAEAFQSLNKKPLRSVLFLWVSGEEIGLYGSQSYVNKPLFPLEKTVVNLNLDMIGRVKEAADSTRETPMTGPTTVFVITDGQSKELGEIAEKTDKKSILDFDYSLSSKDHHLQLFTRSDHFNFVQNDIPVLFFTSGIHTDYHTSRDVIEKINFKKLELVTRTLYQIGFTVANRKERLLVDNPFSSWSKNSYPTLNQE